MELSGPALKDDVQNQGVSAGTNPVSFSIKFAFILGPNMKLKGESGQ